MRRASGLARRPDSTLMGTRGSEMKITPFAVEQWMNSSTRCSHNLAETCVASLTVSELLELSGC
jgi:hypothetical protein